MPSRSAWSHLHHDETETPEDTRDDQGQAQALATPMSPAMDDHIPRCRRLLDLAEERRLDPEDGPEDGPAVC